MSERSVKAYVLALVKRGTEHEVTEKIQRIEDVTEVLITYEM